MPPTKEYPISDKEFWSAFDAVSRGKTRRVELNGAGFLIVIYRVNEQIPVRVDFKQVRK